ncbi:MAG: ATP-binding protein, partial [Candidatus Tectomicrobia bacterium]|nr:ATP-binding protein [Candidatus Tectomicrobia bacterium]
GRVFLNLLNNAFYAIHEKAQTVGDSFAPQLTVQTLDQGDRIAIRIRDNGNGVPPEIQEQLFQPFFTTKPAGAGTGLGLSISRDIIVQGHQGELSVETDVGHYTEFIITLPKQPS